MILSSIVQHVSIARIESLLSNITYESRCVAASGEHGLRAVALCFQFHFQTFPPTTRRSQTNGTELHICFSTVHDIRAARFNAARYSQARVRFHYHCQRVLYKYITHYYRNVNNEACTFALQI